MKILSARSWYALQKQITDSERETAYARLKIIRLETDLCHAQDELDTMRSDYQELVLSVGLLGIEAKKEPERVIPEKVIPAKLTVKKVRK